MLRILKPLVWMRTEFRLIRNCIRQSWKLIPGKYKLALSGAAVLMGITSLVSTLIPLLLGQLVAQLQAVSQAVSHGTRGESAFHSSLYFLTIIGAVYLIRELINVLRRFLVENTCTRINRDMTIGTVNHILRADLQYFTHEKMGALHCRVTRSVDGFVRFIRLSFLDFVPALLTGLFALIVTLYKAPVIGLVMLGLIPTSLTLTLWQLMSQKHIRLKMMRTREEMDGTVIEQLGGLDYVRAANTVESEVKRIARSAERLRVKEIKHHFQMSLFGCGKALTEGFFHIMVLAIGVHLAVKGEIEFAEIFTYSMLFLNVMAPLSEVHRIIDEGQEASLRVNDLLQILDSPIDRSFVASKRISPSMDKPGPIVAVDNLVVEYESADGQTRRALEGVTFEIRRGERIGIAGRSGGGKSTWLKALLRLTHPIAGRVFLGGAPLDEVSRESIAELIGYVGQQPFVCEGTIAQNIAYGIKGATPEQIRQAAEAACIHDEIMAMPGGYNASVSERGQNLSGGQKQRIALARLFLKNPPIMILDEATSALDSISEKRVQRAIAETRPDRTVIIVAHRLSTLLDTDRILVFDHGNIVESGSFNDLVQQAGVFAELLMSSQNPSSSRPVPEHASEQPLQPAALAAT